MDLVFLETQRIKMPHGTQEFRVGETVELPPKVAARLLELIPGKVRIISNAQIAFDLNAQKAPNHLPEEQAKGLNPGQPITVMSPLFGEFEAIVLSSNQRVVWIDHPMLHQESAIPIEWIRR